MMNSIWEFKIQLFPVLAALLIFEIPTFFQKMKRLYYVPIYFSVFPFSQMNQDLSIYLAQDYFGEDISDSDAESLRQKLILVSILSTVIATIIIPGLTGFIGAFFLTKDTLIQYLIILGLYKFVSVSHSIHNFHHHAIATTKNRLFLGIVYFLYIGAVLYNINTVFNWAFPFIVNSNWQGMISAFATILFGKIVLYGIILSLLTALFTSKVADRKVRIENLKGQYSSANEETTYEYK